MSPATATASSTDYSPSIVNTHTLKKILLYDGWHEIDQSSQSNCQLKPFYVGSSPMSDPRSGLRFKDKNSGEWYMVRLDSIQAYAGNDDFSSTT